MVEVHGHEARQGDTAFAFCALKKSFNATPLSSIVTVPVGHTKLIAPVVRFSQVVPELFATSTRKMYGEPYATDCAAVVI